MLTIVIPAYNEEKRIFPTVEKTVNFLSKQSYNTELIIVCDGCTDKTAQLCRSYTNDKVLINVIEYTPNKGKGYAVKTGIMKSTGDLILFMDADYAVPVETVNDFIEQSNNGYDIVIGGRGLTETTIVKHQMFLRELSGKLFGQLQKAILKIPFDDTQCGFKLFKKDIAKELFGKIKYDCSYFDAEVIYLAHKKGCRIKEMPVKWTHDGTTRMPVGFIRTIDLMKKLFMLKSIHKND